MRRSCLNRSIFTDNGVCDNSEEDLALALPVLCVPDWKDAGLVPMQLGDWHAVDARALRVAYYTHHPEADPTPKAVATCRSDFGRRRHLRQRSGAATDREGLRHYAPVLAAARVSLRRSVVPYGEV
jgi:hypothetical protein